jgi:hypothetical protein
MPNSSISLDSGGIVFATDIQPDLFGLPYFLWSYILLLVYGYQGGQQYYEANNGYGTESGILYGNVTFAPYTGPGSELDCPVLNNNDEPQSVHGGGDTGVAAVLAAAAVAPPVFDANFSIAPTVFYGLEYYFDIGWNWAANFSSDSEAEQQVHQGLAVLDGGYSSYIDLTTATGINSAGVVLPEIGGRGSGTGDSEGWSFELVFQPQAVGNWAKLICLGAGESDNDVILGWYGNGEDGRMTFQQYVEGQLNPSATHRTCSASSNTNSSSNPWADSGRKLTANRPLCLLLCLRLLA